MRYNVVTHQILFILNRKIPKKCNDKLFFQRLHMVYFFQRLPCIFCLCASARRASKEVIVLPRTGKPAGILINLEAQKIFDPGYSLVTRGIYYCGRMLSSQKGVEFKGDDYDGIKHVFSIWVCTSGRDYIGNAIVRFHMSKEDIAAGYPDRPSEYDKLTVALICLNEKAEDHHPLTKLLNTIFSEKLSVEEKRTILKEHFGIIMRDDFGKELTFMRTLGEELAERHFQKGLQEGLQEGRQEGRQQANEHTAMRLLVKGVFSDTEIMELADITKEQLQELKERTAAGV